MLITNKYKLPSHYKDILLLFFLASVIFISIQNSYSWYLKNITPTGDPFTYELGFYYLLDTIQNNGYWEGFKRIFANWYWLQNSLIWLFSPFLSKSTNVLCVINFICYALSSIAIYRFFISFDESKKIIALILSSSVWAFPINYTFHEYSSILVMGLDSSFIGSLIGLGFAGVLLIKKPNSFFENIFFIIFFGMSFYGRGNSLLVVGSVLFIPFVFFLIEFFKKNITIKLINFLFISFSILSIISLFYYTLGKNILEYYEVHKYFLDTQVFSIKKTLIYITNIPGIFFFYPKPDQINLMNNYSYIVIIFTILSHILVLLSFFKIIFLKTNKYLKLICVNGFFVFYITLIVNILMWQHEHITIYNAQLIFAPMRIGFLMAVLPFLFLLFGKKEFHHNASKVLLIVFFALYTFALSNYYKDWTKPKSPSPIKISEVAEYIYKNIDDKGYTILIYGFYNPNIFNYYRLRNDQPELKLFYPKHYNDIWIQLQNEEVIKNTRKGLNEIFTGSDLIIIPDKSTFYKNSKGSRYSYYLNQDIFVEELSKQIFNFNLIGKIIENDYNLLILKRDIRNNSNFDFKFDQDTYEITTFNEKSLIVF